MSRKRKTTFRSAKRKNTIIQITNEFKQFKKLTRCVFRNKYGNPYLYKYQRVSPTIINPTKWEIPTLFHLNIISGFVNNKNSHYNSYFKEQQIFISNVEYLLKYHTPFETKIKLYESAQYNNNNNVITIIPNFYPQGNEVMQIVNNYHKDIAKYPFQGRKAYFRYTVRIPTIKLSHMNVYNNNLNENKSSLSSFTSKNEKKSILNTINFIANNKQQEEELDMTIDNEEESKFFSKSLLEKINANDNIQCNTVLKLQLQNADVRRDIRTHYNSFESIEQLINDIQLIEDDLNKLKPKRKERLLNINEHNSIIKESKHSVLLTTIKNEFNKKYLRCNTHYKFKTRKEQNGFHIFNKLNQPIINETTIHNDNPIHNHNNNNFEYHFTPSTILHHKPIDYFLLKHTSSHIKDEKKKHMVTNVLNTYHNRKFNKEKEIKKEKILKMTRQITKPKIITLQTEQRFHKEWLRSQKESNSHSHHHHHRGLSGSRTISHRFCELTEMDTLFCKTHNSIINPNQDKEKFTIEHKTNRLMYKIKKRNDKLQAQIIKNDKTIGGRQISMRSIACYPDIYEHYGMKKKKKN